MSPILKTRSEITAMRTSGQVLNKVMAAAIAAARPGVKTYEIDEAAREAMKRYGATSSFLRYAPWGKRPYPAVICVSVNEQVVHGIPGDRVLAHGDIVSLDCGVVVGGFHADMAVTIPVGDISLEKRRLIETCSEALWAGVRQMRPGAMLSDIARAIESASRPYGVVVGFGGHGVGRELHEPPFVPNTLSQPFQDVILTNGVVLALEPMLNLGTSDVMELDDEWTVVTADGLPSAHFEHTVAVVDDKFEVLTAGVVGA